MKDVARPSDEGASIVVRHLNVRYPGFELGPLSIDIPTGARVALLGPNGAGKSTFMRVVAGIEPEYQGSVSVSGGEVRDRLPTHRRHVGFLPERVVGMPHATVDERLRFLSAFHPDWDAAYADELLRDLELRRDAHIGTLSRGMALKLSFIEAEAYRPPILLLDEPTSGLDPVVRRTFLSLLRGVLEAGESRTLIFSTHLLEDVEAFADRVCVLRNGHLERDQPLSDFHDMEGAGRLQDALLDALAPVPVPADTE